MTLKGSYCNAVWPGPLRSLDRRLERDCNRKADSSLFDIHPIWVKMETLLGDCLVTGNAILHLDMNWWSSRLFIYFWSDMITWSSPSEISCDTQRAGFNQTELAQSTRGQEKWITCMKSVAVNLNAFARTKRVSRFICRRFSGRWYACLQAWAISHPTLAIWATLTDSKSGISMSTICK